MLAQSLLFLSAVIGLVTTQTIDPNSVQIATRGKSIEMSFRRAK
jgi:hypothetical protein